MQWLGILFVGVSFVGIVYFFAVSAFILTFIRKQGCGLPFRYSSTPGWAIGHYQQWCRKEGVEIDTYRLAKYRTSLKVFFASIFGLIFGVVCIAAGGPHA
jgi:hypothetical protein